MRFTDRNYLQNNQYSNPNNLDARIRLHDQYSVNPIGLHEWLLERAIEKLPGTARVLEVGAGHGKLWSANAGRIPDGWEIHLTDLSQGMLSAGMEALAGRPGEFGFASVDAQDLPFPDETFDAVFAHFMLYHVPDRRKAFSAVRRVLRPGGLLLAAALGRNHLKLIYDIVESIDPAGGRDGWKLPFRLDNGAHEMAPHFTDIEQIDYVDSLRVTDAGPLVDYILSMASRLVQTEDQVAALRKDIQARLDRDGVITIPKESGLFTARRRDGA